MVHLFSCYLKEHLEGSKRMAMEAQQTAYLREYTLYLCPMGRLYHFVAALPPSYITPVSCRTLPPVAHPRCLSKGLPSLPAAPQPFSHIPTIIICDTRHISRALARIHTHTHQHIPPRSPTLSRPYSYTHTPLCACTFIHSHPAKRPPESGPAKTRRPPAIPAL